MSETVTPSGWYPLEGDLRYWDGVQWTDETRPRLSAFERAQRLDAELALSLQHGGAAMDVSAEKTGEFDGRAVSRQRTNHLLHLILTLVTCGLWAPLWLLFALTRPPMVRVVHVDEWGRAVWSVPPRNSL